ncbi:uncharacterized protein LOC134474838 [Cavia porcellus]|uniref:uncharacterized protein LOC134474838 n=1 Tax=Cavia porcellus TaxID=10141 RepID=UPI002FE3F68F
MLRWDVDPFPAAAAAPRGAGGVRVIAPPGLAPFARPVSAGGAPCGAEAAAGPGAPARRGRRRGTTRAGGRRTMRPEETRAARVGPGCARVAECVCMCLSVKADRPRPIGQAPPPVPAHSRRPLVGLNTKAPDWPRLPRGPSRSERATSSSRVGGSWRAATPESREDTARSDLCLGLSWSSTHRTRSLLYQNTFEMLQVSSGAASPRALPCALCQGPKGTPSSQGRPEGEAGDPDPRLGRE